MFKEKYLEYNPKANPNNIIQGENYRISLLTSKLVRLEYSKNNKFEDSKTKMVLNRYFDDVKYTLIEEEDSLKIVTDDITIRYDKKEFSSYGLSVSLNEQKYHPYNCVYRYNESYANLGGTIRTLDFIDGEVKLDDGILSKYGIAHIDDSNSPILTDDGWYKSRESNDIDVYVFAYQREYLEALKDFYKLTGKQPKLPRYALGNWWSRYYAYTDKEYLNLMKRFKSEKIPFSVAIIDMDWHLGKWTSYTWNKPLFPNPEAFLKELKSENYAVSLNIHPSDGIRDFEDMYDDFAKAMNVKYNLDIDFEYKKEKFFENMFKYIYYPNEKIGVDFWWLDWQQSPKIIDENKDALWVLNHYQFNDNRKDNKLGIVLSRYSGIGAHRYPIGFSGDVDITWESLDFQPYFTLTASNIGYGWWSHDIGGHRFGYKDEQLQLRWLQFGVFSPINRLHSSNSSFLNKEPWNYEEPYASIMKEYLRLRHELIPYTYTMNILANEEDIPLIRPMYYYYPNDEKSYEVKNQYFFGSNLLICPITSKINEETRRAQFKAWLPKGNWYDYQSGLKYIGNRNIVINKEISEMGIFFKEGSIIPLASLSKEINDISNPKNLKLIIGSGDNGEFVLKEDFIGKEFENETCNTKIEYLESENILNIYPAIGSKEAIPSKRSWQVNIYGKKLDKAMYINEIDIKYDENLNMSSFEIKDISIEEKISIKLNDSSDKFNEREFKLKKIEEFLKSAYIKNVDKERLNNICKENKSISLIISEIIAYECIEEIKKVLIEILSA